MLDETHQNEAEEKPPILLPPPDKSLQSFSKLRRYITLGRIPWRKVSSRKKEELCNMDQVTPTDVGYRNNRPFPLKDHFFVPKLVFQQGIKARFQEDITHASISNLRERHPDRSAAQTLSFLQILMFGAFLAGFCFSIINFTMPTIIAFNTIITVYFILAIGYRFTLMVYGAKYPKPRYPDGAISSEKLPIITILLPLYFDKDALITLKDSIEKLDYPEDKKDVKLLLEEDDDETLIEAKRLGLDNLYEIIVVSEAGPKTKPKACNFGMHLARGELIVIFDAEDQPEVDQLKKAAHAFQHAPPELACVQARLNYYNANENWLTRLFTLEYSLWFDWLLPALQKLNAPIPLGGTSNYFRTDTLLKVGGWDPFNVTEDADLGLRLSKLGYQVEMLNSTTFEEANCKTKNWIRQRSRWMKGHMQTWFVHMRNPHQFVKTSGWSGLLSVQLFLAGNVVSALINPILWMVFIVWLLTRAEIISHAFPGPLLWLNIFALTVGNLFFVLLAVVAPLKRRWFHLSLSGFTAPLYWLLTSLAAYKAIWQLIFRPFYWEKTEHGISEIAIAKRDALIGKQSPQ